MTATTAPDSFVTVKSLLPKLPFPPNSSREPIRTQRLLIRPFTADDAEALHQLRSEEAVMRWTSRRCVDADLAETRAKLASYLAPNDAITFVFAICAADTGELIGSGGCHKRVSDLGWPELGYMLRQAYWGRGLGTEFVRAFLDLWAALPHAEMAVRVDPRTVVDVVGGRAGAEAGVGAENGLPPSLVDEQIIAMTEDGNVPSQNVLRKCGFEYLLTLSETDPTAKDGEPIKAPIFRFFPSAKAGQP